MRYKIIGLKGRTLIDTRDYVEAWAAYNSFQANGIRCSLVKVEDVAAVLREFEASYGY